MQGHAQVLVQRKDQSSSAASWEDVDQFQQRYPDFQLEDKLFLEGGSDVMWGRTYGRRQRQKE
jgi:transcriptional regulator GlxA family with amidase domain